MVSLGVEGTEVGAWARKLSPLLPGCAPWTQSSGAWAALTGRSSFEVLPRASLLHSLRMCPTCSTRGIPPAVLRCLKAGICSSVLLKHLSAPVSTPRWRGRQVLLRGVYSQELANPGTGSLHDLNLDSPCSPSLKCHILVTGSTGLPRELELF